MNDASITWTIRMGGKDSNTGVIMARQLLRDTICDLFGGYTERLVRGGWRDPKTDILYREVVFEITSDSVFDDPQEEEAARASIRELLTRCKELTGEQCIYVNQTYGYTDFI